MRIQGRPLTLAPPPRPRPAAQPVDVFTSSGLADSGERLWRDFGIHPVAMARRLTVDRPTPGGSPIPGGRPANPMVMAHLSARLAGVVEGLDGLDSFKSGLEGVAREFGLAIDFERGTPTVNWSGDGRLEIRESGGPSAFHELVHGLQCVLGGAAALGTVAADHFRRAYGRQPANLAELKPFLAGLTEQDRKSAFDQLVRPMETTAYSRFEQSAFHTTGLFGRKSRDLDLYRQRLGQTLEAFSQAYATATVPRLDTALDAAIYGGLGHVARTHGETAVLLGAAGFGYYHLARTAVGIHPLLAMPVVAPLGYVLYRALVTG
ncbi:MAG: hypothetical protein AB7S38_24005 [Vulcanimicrobiota bacterium]